VEREMAPTAAAASSGGGGGGLLVAAACAGRQGSSSGGAAGGGAVAGPGFFYLCSFIFPCVGSFAVCHEHFTDTCMPCARCRVLHTAKLLLCAIWALPCAPGTRQTTRFR